MLLYIKLSAYLIWILKGWIFKWLLTIIPEPLFQYMGRVDLH